MQHAKGGNSVPVHQSLNNGHLRLLELLFGVTTSRVGQVNGMADLDVIRQRNVFYLDAKIAIVNYLHRTKADEGSLLCVPFSEQLNLLA
jgi:hypothetical protein